jgi:hypothetical protein
MPSILSVIYLNLNDVISNSLVLFYFLKKLPPLCTAVSLELPPREVAVNRQLERPPAATCRPVAAFWTGGKPLMPFETAVIDLATA